MAGTGNRHLSVPFLLSLPLPFLAEEESHPLEGTAPADSGVYAPPCLLFQSSLSPTPLPRDVGFLIALLGDA